MTDTITNAQLTQQITTLIASWTTREAQFKDWVGGTATGGPNSDGRLPLSDYLGTSYLISCPAALASSVSGPALASGLSATAALASATAAAASATAADTRATAAAASVTAAQAARDLAVVAKNTAATSAASALTYQNTTQTAAATAVAAAASAGSATVSTSLVCDVAVVAGAPLAIDRATGHFVKADASIYTRAFVVGLAVSATAATFVAYASTAGTVTRADWTSVAGTATLSAGQLYFLAAGGGITLTRPTAVGKAVSLIGEATSDTTLSLRLSQPILL